MGTLASAYFKLETLETLVKTLKTKKENGIELTVSINDESNQYGNNVSVYVSQSKEDREAKKDRFFTANGKVFWTDGTVKLGSKSDAPVSTGGDDDSLPF